MFKLLIFVCLNFYFICVCCEKIHPEKLRQYVPPEFYLREVRQTLKMGSKNQHLRVPILISEIYHKNLSFIVVKQGKEHKHLEYSIKRLSGLTVELYIPIKEVNDDSYGLYDVIMELPNKRREFCLLIAEHEKNMAGMIAGSLFGVFVAAALIILMVCYLQQRTAINFRRMHNEDDSELQLDAVDTTLNDDVFLPDVAHTSGSARMVAMATITDEGSEEVSLK